MELNIQFFRLSSFTHDQTRAGYSKFSSEIYRYHVTNFCRGGGPRPTQYSKFKLQTFGVTVYLSTFSVIQNSCTRILSSLFPPYGTVPVIRMQEKRVNVR